MRAFHTRGVLPYGRLADFIGDPQNAGFLEEVLPEPEHGSVYLFCVSDAKNPEFEGEFVDAVSSTPGPGPMRFQSRRRDLHWHMIHTQRTRVVWRTAHGLAVVRFSPTDDYSAIAEDQSFSTDRMLPMKSRQLALERLRTGDSSLTSLGTVKHKLGDWSDPRIEAALRYARQCRKLRSGIRERNVMRFLNGEPCKNLIYFIAFRQRSDPISPFLIYVGQTRQTFESRMKQHFEAHATLADTLCCITPPEDMIAFVLDVETDGDDLDMLESEAIAFFSCVTMYGANMIHGHEKTRPV